jgi:hypothetical protein
MDMTQLASPNAALPVPATADLTAALASLAAPEALLIIVDEQGRIRDVRKASPAFLAANLVAAAQNQRPAAQGGNAACPSDAGPYPWLSG